MNTRVARFGFVRFSKAQRPLGALLLALLTGWTWQCPGQWIALTNGTPSSRVYSALAEEASRDKLVLFGGSPDSTIALSDTWSWSSAAATWQPLNPAGPRPPGRFVHGMATFSNAASSYVLLFGGQGTNATFLRDTWKWNGSTWQAGPTNGPSARVLVGMAEESFRQRVLLFGGFDGALLGDTWEWDGTNWSQLPVTGPTARAGHAMAYDAVRNRVVMFGGQDNNNYQADVWEFASDLAWHKITPATTNNPVARRDHVLARLGNRIVLYGGANVSGQELNDTWEWDGTNWIQTVSGFPGARFGACMAPDTLNQATLLFGGGNSTNALSDTKRYSGPIIKVQPYSTVANLGQPATFSIQVNTGGATPTFQWQRNVGGGFGNIIGATSNLYTIGSTTSNDAGAYRCLVQLASSSATSLSAQLGLRPPCVPASYSINIPTGYSLIANQVDIGGNTLNDVFPAGPPGAIIFKWDPVTCSYVISRYDTNGVWVPNLSLAPGEGAYFYNPGPLFAHLFNGCAHTPVLPISIPTNCCIIVSRQTNGIGNWTNITGFPPGDGYKVFRFNNGGYTAYQWDDIDQVWTPSDPVASVGEAVWICCPTCSFSTPCAPPQIVLQPVSQTVGSGCCVTFSTTVSGSPPFGYQWQFNGANIAGATGSSYTICPASAANTGSYSVNVTNPCGSTKSIPATLAVTNVTSLVLNCPTNDIVVFGNSPGTNVYYDVTAALGCDTNVFIQCTPPSGSLFPCGTNTVTCIASDSTGVYSSMCSFKVIVLCDCLGFNNEKLTPANGVPNVYNYNFDLINSSGVPIKFLYIVPTAGCQSASPDIINFNPPIPPGGVTNISTLLSFASGCTNRCFTFSAHTLDLSVCCTVVHCLPTVRPPPVIVIAVTPPTVKLTWPDSYPDYQLESTLNLRPPTIWSNVNAQLTTTNGTIYVNVPYTNAARFFRLRLP